MGRKKKAGWRDFLQGLTPAERDAILCNLLEWQIDDLGIDSEIRFHEADDDHPAALYWAGSGDSLTEART